MFYNKALLFEWEENINIFIVIFVAVVVIVVMVEGFAFLSR